MEPVILRESLFLSLYMYVCACARVCVWSGDRFHLLSFSVRPLYSDSAR